MLIAIDIDDVLADFSEGFIKYLKHAHNRDVEIHDLKIEEWWSAWGKSQDQAVETIQEFLKSKQVSELEPKDGAARALKLLKQAGHKLVVITGRPVAAHKMTRQWVHDNLPAVFDEVYCTDFHIVNHNPMTKGTICAELGVDILVDDYPGYARECVGQGVTVLLFESFWNHGFEPTPGIIPVSNWSQVLEYVGKHEK